MFSQEAFLRIRRDNQAREWLDEMGILVAPVAPDNNLALPAEALTIIGAADRTPDEIDHTDRAA